MALSLPNSLVAGTPEDVSKVQGNFDTIANNFPLAVNTTNFSQVPQCRLTNTVAQTLGNGAATALTFDTETFDTGTPSNNMHDTGSNTSRITCRVAGLYLITGIVSFVANGTGSRGAGIRLNGTTALPGSAAYVPGNASVSSAFTVTTTYRLAVNDYVELMGYQSSGGNLNTNIITAIAGHDTRPLFEAVMVSV